MEQHDTARLDTTRQVEIEKFLFTVVSCRPCWFQYNMAKWLIEQKENLILQVQEYELNNNYAIIYSHPLVYDQESTYHQL